jgi:hypothetical protein
MKYLPIFLILSLALGSCKEKCKDAICTMEFAIVGVTVESSNNPNLEGITTRTSFSGSGNVLHDQGEPFHLNNFRIVDDSDLEKIGFNNQKSVLFEVFLNQKLIHSETYIVGADCCHVRKESGKDNIVLD